MEKITNAYKAADALTEKAKTQGEKMRDDDNKKYYPDGEAPYTSFYPYSFGILSGEVSNLFREIKRLQEELDKPRCEECGSDCTKVWSRDTYLGEATTLYCESCDHESEPW